jgi:hypothetical protein
MDKNILIIKSNTLETHFESTSNSEITFDIESYLGDFNADSNDLLNIVKEPYAPQKGDKIYFLPSVSVPRVKFKNVSLEYGIKTVRDPEQANVFFGCSKSIHSMTNNTWFYRASVKDFLSFIEAVDYRLDGHTKDTIETALEFYEKEHIGVSWNIMNCMVATIKDVKVSKYSERIVYIEDDFKEEFLRLQSIKIYDESSVIDILNGEEAAVIDRNMFEHIREMFKSSDKDNHVLAMEIMANSKYTDSLIYLELLFYYYAHKIMDTHTKNHVNFKSLVSYLGKDMRGLHTDIDGVTRSLINKDQFTPDKVEIVMEYLHEDIVNSGNSDYYTVKTISVNPEFIAQLGTNYTYQVQDDYVGPEIPVEFDEEEERVAVPVPYEMMEDNFEVESDTNDVYGVDTALTSESVKIFIEAEEDNTQSIIDDTLSNNNQITQTNGNNDLDWF